MAKVVCSCGEVYQENKNGYQDAALPRCHGCETLFCFECYGTWWTLRCCGFPYCESCGTDAHPTPCEGANPVGGNSPDDEIPEYEDWDSGEAYDNHDWDAAD